MLFSGSSSERRRIPAGTKVYLGAPARPMKVELSVQIAKMLRHIPGIVEAHVPQCYAPGVIDNPAQMLILVVNPKAARSAMAAEIEKGLAMVLPVGTTLDFISWRRLRPNCGR